MLHVQHRRTGILRTARRIPRWRRFGGAFDERSPLDRIVHEGAQQMLQAAIDAEVNAFVEQHALRRDVQGRRLVVRNGRLPGREILTGAGPLEASVAEPGGEIHLSSSLSSAVSRAGGAFLLRRTPVAT